MDKSKQAFPLQHAIADANDKAFKLGHPGMTLREYAAVAAMQGLLAKGEFQYDAIVSDSVALADALIAKMEESQHG